VFGGEGGGGVQLQLCSYLDSCFNLNINFGSCQLQSFVEFNHFSPASCVFFFFFLFKTPGNSYYFNIGKLMLLNL